MKMIKIKIPDTNKAGIGFIKIAIKGLSEKKLLGVKGIIDSYPESEEKTELLIELKKEFEKRKLEWFDL